MASLREPIDLAEYIFLRLKQSGIGSVFGVPGDYNLGALDYIGQAGLKWVGDSNELNAGYAADGYGRLNHLAVLVTTFGVGELSAANAIAGSYAEYVPVLHIVGTPSTASQRDGMLMHHTLGNGDFTVFSRMAGEITCASARLEDANSAAERFDDIVRTVVMRSRPGYVTLPTDMVGRKVEGARLRTPLDFSISANDKKQEDFVVGEIMSALEKAQKPCILVDACAIRHRAVSEVDDLVRLSRLPTFVTPMGKSAVDEGLSNFGGVYSGAASDQPVRDFIESSDLVLTVGSLKTDLNTSGFSVRLSELRTIDLQSTYTRARYAEFPGVQMHGVISRLTEALQTSQLSLHGQVAPSDSLALRLSPALGPVAPLMALQEAMSAQAKPAELVTKRAQDLISSLSLSDSARVWADKITAATSPTVWSKPVTHDYFWARMTAWLEPDDVVITETGTSNFGICGTRFPARVRAVNQILWGSIGYATGACVGAAIAVRDEHRLSKSGSPPVLCRGRGRLSREKKADQPGRTILFTGDGSFQMTVQAVSTMLRNGLTPIVFLLQNQGYTIERYIHGMEEVYNDIPEWDYAAIPAVFGAEVERRSGSAVGGSSAESGWASHTAGRIEQKMRSYLRPTGTAHPPGSESGVAGTDSIRGRAGDEGVSGSEKPVSQTSRSGSCAARRLPLGRARTWVVKSRAELEGLLADQDGFGAANDVLRFVELHMPWDDAPESMVTTAKSAATRTAK